VIPIDFEYFIH